MKIVKLAVNRESFVLSEAQKILSSGGIVAGPTDTVYGIFGDATKETVIRKMFAMKQRSGKKAFPIFVKDIPTARKFASISDDKARLLERMWPGKVTAVFYHKDKLPAVLTGGLDTIGIRVPEYPFLLTLLARLAFPLAQTSANISAEAPAKTAREIKARFGCVKIRPDLVIDGGEISRQPSTVLDFTGAEPKILRTGIISSDVWRRFFQKMKGVDNC